MNGETWNRSPEEWQELVVQLLYLRYPIGQFQPIPDRDRGDCGLEGFSRDGVGYQCYAVEEPVTTAELSKKQKKKITNDLLKLVRYSDHLPGLLNPTILS